jgi:hypothetical protein
MSINVIVISIYHLQKPVDHEKESNINVCLLMLDEISTLN